MTHAPALALGWQLWVRQRWAMITILVYLTALSVACRQTFAAEWRGTLLMATVPLVFGALFVILTFHYLQVIQAGAQDSQQNKRDYLQHADPDRQILRLVVELHKGFSIFDCRFAI